MRSNLYTEIDNISLSFIKFQDYFTAKINSLISHLTNFQEEAKENLDLLLTSNLKKIGEIGKQSEEDLSETLSEVSTKFENSREDSYSSLSKAVKERFDAITNYVDQLGNILDKKLENNNADLDVALLKFHNTTGQHMEETINKNTAKMTQFRKNIVESFDTLQNGQTENIEKTIKDLRNILRSKQSDLITTISSLEPIAEEHIEAYRLTVDEKNEETNQLSVAAFNDLRREIDALQQNSLETIKNVVETTHQQLDDNVKSSDINIASSLLWLSSILGMGIGSMFAASSTLMLPLPIILKASSISILLGSFALLFIRK